MNAAADIYNYTRFSPDRYDFAEFNAPVIGEQAPDFSAVTSVGKVVKLSDFLGQPIVLELGSITCPVYAGLTNKMNQLADVFPDVQFLLLYVREAHPGERCGAHQSLDEKQERARETQNRYGENRTILMDDLEGTAHQLYGMFPNSVFLINKHGKIAWRAKWNRPEVLKEALEKLKSGEQMPPELTSEIPGGSRFSALLKGGWLAVWDFVKAFPVLVWQKFFKT
mgnify:CR=1 FL=1